MANEKAEHTRYGQKEAVASGDYEAQRQLDYRLVKDEHLKIVSPGGGPASDLSQSSSSSRR
jgi:hypothetical protein